MKGSWKGTHVYLGLASRLLQHIHLASLIMDRVWGSVTRFGKDIKNNNNEEAPGISPYENPYPIGHLGPIFI